MKNANDASLPFAGAALLTDQKLNYFAVDNNGTSDDNPGVYDDFTMNEKWYMLSNGIKRSTSSLCDASMVISAGPIKLKQNESTPVVFCLFSGENKDSLDKAIQVVKNNHIILSVNSGELPNLNCNFLKIYPNPAESDNINIEIELKKSDCINIDLYDAGGKLLRQLLPNSTIDSGRKVMDLNLNNLNSGAYFIKLSGSDGSQMQPAENNKIKICYIELLTTLRYVRNDIFLKIRWRCHMMTERYQLRRLSYAKTRKLIFYVQILIIKNLLFFLNFAKVYYF